MYCQYKTCDDLKIKISYVTRRHSPRIIVPRTKESLERKKRYSGERDALFTHTALRENSTPHQKHFPKNFLKRI